MSNDNVHASNKARQRVGGAFIWIGITLAKIIVQVWFLLSGLDTLKTIYIELINTILSPHNAFVLAHEVWPIM